jgi:hypothetical protein
MPRSARLDAPGVLHHVMGRGLDRQVIFRDDRVREDFLRRLAALAEASALMVYAWALLPNHFHLLECPLYDREGDNWQSDEAGGRGTLGRLGGGPGLRVRGALERPEWRGVIQCNGLFEEIKRLWERTANTQELRRGPS